MSSPFRSSHRRTRSHTSLSSPSSHHVQPGSDRHRFRPSHSPLLIGAHPCGATEIPSDSPFSKASAFTAQPPEKWDVEAWRRGKRARRDPKIPSEDADMESGDEQMSSSPIAESLSLSSPLSASAPSTPFPRFASTSDAFQFFPPRSSPSANRGTSSGALLGSRDRYDESTDLERLQSEAFNDLRKTVSEAGEGFVRRMREFEAHRTRGPSRVSTGLPQSDKPAPFKRGRKRPSPRSARERHAQHQSIGIIQDQGGDSEDGDSDIEICSTCASGADSYRAWSPSKKRAVSLSALSYQDAADAMQPIAIPLRSRQRSASPSGSDYSGSSSDDEEIASSSGSVSHPRRHRRALRFQSKAASSVKSSPPPLSFSFSTSNNSSHLSLGASASSASVLGGTSNMFYCPPEHQNAVGGETKSSIPPIGHIDKASKSTEKAVAALTLALANGAGSVSDYEALREAQNVLAMETSEAGNLWD